MNEVFQSDFESDELSSRANCLAQFSKRSEISRVGSTLKHLINESKDWLDIDFNISEENSDNGAAEILIMVMKKYTHGNYALDYPTCVPLLVRQLCELNQHKTLLRYLSMLQGKSIGMLYAQAYSMTCLGEKLTDKQAFRSTVMDLICTTLTLSPKA